MNRNKYEKTCNKLKYNIIKFEYLLKDKKFTSTPSISIMNKRFTVNK